MTARRFSEEVNSYTVLLLKLDEYQPSLRVLPNGLQLAGAEKLNQIRQQERRLLQDKFEDWDIPYHAGLGGWRVDSPIYVVRGNELIGGVYLCEKNEFDDNPGRGQLHYMFVSNRFTSQGIYSVMFREAVQRATAWGLKELLVNTDRYLLPEVHMRWGMKPWKTITKKSRLPQTGIVRLLRGARRQILRIWKL